MVKNLILSSMVAVLMAGQAFAGPSLRKIIFEVDPIAPASAAYDEKVNDMTNSKFGVNVDFNIGGVVSTGPEVWSGAFYLKGAEEDYRREDLQPGERHKITATRLRWNITKWEVPSNMRGWYVKMAYNYLKIDSRANRYTEVMGGPGDLTIDKQDDPSDETDLITDERHGAVFGFGERWLVAEQTMSITVGLSINSDFKRKIAVDSSDPYARADYDEVIEDLPDTRLTTRPLPEANLSIGYAF
ncbi:MAG: hypothetical protein AB7T49_04980 [Oligoflexales bacterium]